MKEPGCTIVILSGDADFLPAIEAALNQNCEIEVSLRLRASSLQVEFPKHFTLSDIGKTLLIMVGKCKGFNMNVLSIKVWSCHFACDLNIQVKIVVVTKV